MSFCYQKSLKNALSDTGLRSKPEAVEKLDEFLSSRAVEWARVAAEAAREDGRKTITVEDIEDAVLGPASPPPESDQGRADFDGDGENHGLPIIRFRGRTMLALQIEPGKHGLNLRTWHPVEGVRERHELEPKQVQKVSDLFEEEAELL